MDMSLKNKIPMERRPKVELHIHLDGSVRPETIWEIASKRGISLPCKDVTELRSLLNIPLTNPKTLTDVLDKFNIFMPVICGNEESIKRIAYEFCEDLYKDNVIYAEARIAPHLLCNSISEQEYVTTRGTLTPKHVVEIVLESLAEGLRDFGVMVKLILVCLRHKPEWSSEVVDLCHEFRNKGVVGIDLAGDENLTKIWSTQKQHVSAFQRAKELGIHRTVHAGENGPAENVRLALDEMSAERIGHGYHATSDETLYQRMLSEDIHFEMCPFSSIVTGSVSTDYHTHPLHRVAEDGGNFSVNSDDPTITGGFLQSEYKCAKDVLKLSEKHLVMANLNAVRSCFLDEEEKKKLENQIKSEYKEDIELYIK